jgi:two-component system sensor histidine kinase YesM
VLVPSLLLQPLVENALRHGATGQLLEIDVRARREGAELAIEVADNGPGADPEAEILPPGGPRIGAPPSVAGVKISQKGLGLAASAERLRLLYRGKAKLTFGNRPEGGFAVRLRIPARPARPA